MECVLRIFNLSEYALCNDIVTTVQMIEAIFNLMSQCMMKFGYSIFKQTDLQHMSDLYNVHTVHEYRWSYLKLKFHLYWFDWGIRDKLMQKSITFTRTSHRRHQQVAGKTVTFKRPAIYKQISATSQCQTNACTFECMKQMILAEKKQLVV